MLSGLPKPSSKCAYTTSRLRNGRAVHDDRHLIQYKEPSIDINSNQKSSVATIAFGSNLGNRIDNIENAIDLVRARDVKIIALSHLYETKPMYYEEQDNFLNGVFQVETTLSAIELLDELQAIENELGRVRTVQNGPRTIDLDILDFGGQQIRNDRLNVPHPRIQEREFVLRPLCDLMRRTGTKLTGRDVNEALQKVTDPMNPARAITLVGNSHPVLSTTLPNRKTHIMSILNITPDSFSDGGNITTTDPQKLTDVVLGQLADGATILDVGGQSTRPGAMYLSAQEELERILPVLHHIKNLRSAFPQTFLNAAISVDTFHSAVARVCIEKELCDMINDVSAGTMDVDMLATIANARPRVSCCLMHMRGTPETMNKLTDYPQGVVQGVADELAARVQAALQAGIPPWRIILDPGIGFAKNQQQNLELLRTPTSNIAGRTAVLSEFPWLVGTSRKGFIGKVTGVRDAHRRVLGTAACVTAAVSSGADVVRVHDVAEMREVVQMADAIYRC